MKFLYNVWFVALAGLIEHTLARDNFVKVAGSLSQISATNGLVCGVGGGILCVNGGIQSRTPTWENVNVPKGSDQIKQIAVNGREMVVVDNLDQIYHGTYNGGRTAWTQIPGKLRQVSIDNKQICGGTVASELFCGRYKSGVPKVDLVKIAGILNQLVVRGHSAIGLNNYNQAYQGAPYGGAGNGWGRIVPTQLTQISWDAENDILCGVELKNEAFCANNEDVYAKPEWKKLEKPYKYVEVFGGKVYAISPNNEIYYGELRKGGDEDEEDYDDSPYSPFPSSHTTASPVE